MSIWFDLSQFENWFIDCRGSFMGVFTITASLGYLHQLHQKVTHLTMMMILLLDHKIHLDGLSTPLPLRIPIFLRGPGLPLLQPLAHQPSQPGLLPVAVIWANQLSFWDLQAQRPWKCHLAAMAPHPSQVSSPLFHHPPSKSLSLP